MVGIICLVFARSLSRRSRHMSLRRQSKDEFKVARERIAVTGSEVPVASQMEHFIEQPWCSYNTLMILK